MGRRKTCTHARPASLAHARPGADAGACTGIAAHTHTDICVHAHICTHTRIGAHATHLSSSMRVCSPARAPLDSSSLACAPSGLHSPPTCACACACGSTSAADRPSANVRASKSLVEVRGGAGMRGVLGGACVLVCRCVWMRMWVCRGVSRRLGVVVGAGRGAGPASGSRSHRRPLLHPSGSDVGGSARVFGREQARVQAPPRACVLVRDKRIDVVVAHPCVTSTPRPITILRHPRLHRGGQAHAPTTSVRPAPRTPPCGHVMLHYHRHMGRHMGGWGSGGHQGWHTLDPSHPTGGSAAQLAERVRTHSASLARSTRVRPAPCSL
jgi:hypothetical protein